MAARRPLARQRAYLIQRKAMSSQPYPDRPPRLHPVNRSGIEIPVNAGPDAVDPAHIGEPGQYPFTRGIFPDGYQGRLWTFRQYSGFGTAEESTARYKFLLAPGPRSE